MKLPTEQAMTLLGGQDHGILCTVHPVRGVDAVPVVFALDDGGMLGIPIDRVKPKSTARLQRERNLDADPRATLLVEHWDANDWSRLWWVRAELHRVVAASPDVVAGLGARLAGRYPQYSDQPFSGILVLRVVKVSGWAAAGPGSA
jgi:hypothetical protein